ncbi:hypothetical protein TNCV_3323991 [Trichonephila clavipes]|nr:hypothetical protein TNCV_3323991 [Trichonephila clavipes]
MRAGDALGLPKRSHPVPAKVIVVLRELWGCLSFLIADYRSTGGLFAQEESSLGQNVFLECLFSHLNVVG